MGQAIFTGVSLGVVVGLTVLITRVSSLARKWMDSYAILHQACVRCVVESELEYLLIGLMESRERAGIHEDGLINAEINGKPAGSLRGRR